MKRILKSTTKDFFSSERRGDTRSRRARHFTLLITRKSVRNKNKVSRIDIHFVVVSVRSFFLLFKVPSRGRLGAAHCAHECVLCKAGVCLELPRRKKKVSMSRSYYSVHQKPFAYSSCFVPSFFPKTKHVNGFHHIYVSFRFVYNATSRSEGCHFSVSGLRSQSETHGEGREVKLSSTFAF